jgi:hypothetical protein
VLSPMCEHVTTLRTVAYVEPKEAYRIVRGVIGVLSWGRGRLRHSTVLGTLETEDELMEKGRTSLRSLSALERGERSEGLRRAGVGSRLAPVASIFISTHRRVRSKSSERSQRK